MMENRLKLNIFWGNNFEATNLLKKVYLDEKSEKLQIFLKAYIKIDKKFIKFDDIEIEKMQIWLR